MLDEDVRFEAISATLGAKVRPLSEFQKTNPGKSPENQLTLENFLVGAILGVHSLLLNPVSWIVSMFSWFFVSEETPTATDTANDKEFFVDEAKFFDRKFDYDLTETSDSTRFERGGEQYTRPCGWYRIGLKVLNKYEDNKWLGSDGIRTHSVPGEWPVSYHGTSDSGVKSIVRSNFKSGNNPKRQVYGKGIYSTPDLLQAGGYATEFVSEKNGKKYKVILQNRVNPAFREKHRQNEDYWLIPVPEGTSDVDERKIVERAIRPYGILLREV